MYSAICVFFSHGVSVCRYSPYYIFSRGALCVRLMWSDGPERQDHQMSLSQDVGLYFFIPECVILEYVCSMYKLLYNYKFKPFAINILNMTTGQNLQLLWV